MDFEVSRLDSVGTRRRRLRCPASSGAVSSLLRSRRYLGTPAPPPDDIKFIERDPRSRLEHLSCSSISLNCFAELAERWWPKLLSIQIVVDAAARSSAGECLKWSSTRAFPARRLADDASFDLRWDFFAMAHHHACDGSAPPFPPCRMWVGAHLRIHAIVSPCID